MWLIYEEKDNSATVFLIQRSVDSNPLFSAYCVRFFKNSRLKYFNYMKSMIQIRVQCSYTIFLIQRSVDNAPLFFCT